MDEQPFTIGRIVERNVGAPAPLRAMASASASTSNSNNNNSQSSSTAAAALSFPKPMPNKRYTTRQPAAATTSAASSEQHQHQPPQQQQQQHTGNMGPPPALIGEHGQVIMPDGGPKQEQPIVTSEFLQVLKATMNSNNKHLTLDAGATEKVRGSDDGGDDQPVAIDTILRVVRSSVASQRAAGMTALQARCDAFVAERNSNNKKSKSKSAAGRKYQQQFQQDHFIQAPPDIIAALFHEDEAGPRLALLSHLAYEDPSHTVREAAFLCWLSMLNSCSDDTIDTHVLSAIAGAPTDVGDEADESGEDGEHGSGALEKKQDADELRRRRVKFDKCPPELDDVDVRCGPTGIKIERKYFTLEAVTTLLLTDPALGMARLGVYRTLLDRAVGRAADHDPEGSTLSATVGGISLLDSTVLWRCVASAAHHSPTAAGYMCEHKSFRVAFQKLIVSTMGIDNGDKTNNSTDNRSQPQQQQQQRVKIGHALLPCVRDALVAIHSAVHSNSDRAHRLLPVLWHPSDGSPGLFLLMKFLELPADAPSPSAEKNRSNNIKETHCASYHFAHAGGGEEGGDAGNPRSTSSWISQCSALMCCLIRAAVRFGVDLSEEIDEDAPIPVPGTEQPQEDKKTAGVAEEEEEEAVEIVDSLAKWIGDVLPFLTSACDSGSFAVFEMLLINSAKQQLSVSLNSSAAEKTRANENEEKKKQQSVEEEQEENKNSEEKRKALPAATTAIAPTHFIKSDLKRIVDDFVFPAVEQFLAKRSSASCVFSVGAATACHLLATWISEGSLSDVFHGESDETALLARLEPILDKSLAVVLTLCRDSGTRRCMVQDSLAQGLCRIVDGIARCYPKVRMRVAFHMQGFFSALITSDGSPLRSQQHQPNANKDNGQEDVDDESKEAELATVTPLAFVGEILQTAHWMLQVVDVDEKRDHGASSSHASSSLMKQQQQQQQPMQSLIRSEVLCCVALALVRKALQCGGGAESAITAGLTLLLPIDEKELVISSSSSSSTLFAKTELREELAANIMNMISGAEFTSSSASSKSNKKKTDEKSSNDIVAALPRSLPVSAITSDPLFAWLLSPCLAVRKKTVAPTSDSDDEDDNAAARAVDEPVKVENDPVATGNIRSAWIEWLSGIFTKVLAVSNSSTASPLMLLLPHPLSCLAAVFLAMHCNESAYDAHPKFSERQILHFRSAASVFFTLCCCKGVEGATAAGSVENGRALFSVLVTSATFNPEQILPQQQQQSQKQSAGSAAAAAAGSAASGAVTLRKDCLETIVRCAADSVGGLDMLLVFTVAVLLRGHPEQGATLLSQLWLKRASWILSVPTLMETFPWMRQDCFSCLAAKSQSPSVSAAGAAATTVKEHVAAARRNFYCAAPARTTKLFTEKDAMEQCSGLLDELGAVLPRFGQQQPQQQNQPAVAVEQLLLVKAAVSLVAEYSSACSEFVQSSIDGVLEGRQGREAAFVVEKIKELRRASSQQVPPVMFWLNDIC